MDDKDKIIIQTLISLNEGMYKHDQMFVSMRRSEKRQRRSSRVVGTITLAVAVFTFVTSRSECNELYEKVDRLQTEVRELRRKEQEGK